MKHEPQVKCAKHLLPLLLPKQLRRVIREACAELKTKDFDAIAFRGLSGSLIAPILAMRLNKTLLAVRKPEEKTHSPYNVEGDLGAQRYIIVDDFIDSGATCQAILDGVRDEVPNAVFVGFYAYAYTWDDSTKPKTPIPYFRTQKEIKKRLSY